MSNEEHCSSSDEEEAEEGEVADENGFTSDAFSLSPQLIENLKRRGLETPTEVQRKVIPRVRNERAGDLCVNAPTGSGKTLAYALPITQVRISRLT